MRDLLPCSGFLRGLLLVIGMLAMPTVSLGVDDGPNFSGTVNCGDSSTSSSCIECCSGAPGCTFGKITCCPLTGECTVTNKPSGGGGLPLKITQNVGGLKLFFERKIRNDGVDIRLRVGFLRHVFRKGLTFKARLTGDDAKIAGLLFPVVFLGQGANAINSLHGAGYDVAVAGTFPTCQSLFPDQLCSDAAFGLSRILYGALGVGIRSEAQEFVNGTNSMGYGPCQTLG